MGRPLRAVYANTTYSTGIREMSDADLLDTLIPVALNYVVTASPADWVSATLSTSATPPANTVLAGSAVDTQPSGTVGAHPVVTNTNNTYYIYQKTGITPTTPGTMPVQYVLSGAEHQVKSMTLSDLADVIGPLAATQMSTSSQASSFKISLTSSPPTPGTWVPLGTLLDYFYDAGGTLVNDSYTLWMRSSITPNSVVRPLTRGLDGTLVEMTDVQLQPLYQAIAYYFITTGIGLLSFGTTAPGVGSWATLGFFVNKTNNLVDTPYAGTYNQAFTQIYTAPFVGLYNAPYSQNYTGLYNTPYTGVYQGLYTGIQVYTNSYTGTFTRAYSQAYSQIYNRGYTGTFTGFYARGWTGGFTGIFTSPFTNVFTGIYTGFYARGWTGTWAQGFSVSYAAAYTGLWTGGFQGIVFYGFAGFPGPGPVYSSAYVGVYSNDYTRSFTGLFSSTWTGTYTGEYQRGWTGSFSGAFTNIYSGTFTGLYTGTYDQGFTQTYSGQFTQGYSTVYSGGFTQTYTYPIYTGAGGSFAVPYTKPYTGVYTKTYTGIYGITYTQVYTTLFTGVFARGYTGAFTGSYSGVTTQTTTNSTTYYLFIRTS